MERASTGVCDEGGEREGARCLHHGRSANTRLLRSAPTGENKETDVII